MRPRAAIPGQRALGTDRHSSVFIADSAGTTPQAVSGGVTALCGGSCRSSRTRPHTLGSGRLGCVHAPRGTGGRDPRCPRHPVLAFFQPCLLPGGSWGHLSHTLLTVKSLTHSLLLVGEGQDCWGSVWPPARQVPRSGAVSAASPCLCHRSGLRIHSQNEVLEPAMLHRVVVICPLLLETLNLVLMTHASVCKPHCQVHFLSPLSAALHFSASGLES